MGKAESLMDSWWLSDPRSTCAIVHQLRHQGIEHISRNVGVMDPGGSALTQQNLEVKRKGKTQKKGGS